MALMHAITIVPTNVGLKYLVFMMNEQIVGKKVLLISVTNRSISVIYIGLVASVC